MSEDKKISASPKVRKFARELGTNISQIKGTERKGRISEEDVKNFISNQLNETKNSTENEQSSNKQYTIMEYTRNMICIIVSFTFLLCLHFNVSKDPGSFKGI